MVDVTVRLAKSVAKSFPIRGETGEELAAALHANGRAGVFRSNLGIEVAPGGDSITVVRISADPVVLLPEWRGASRADKDLKKRWDKVVQLIARHEAAHERDFRGAIKAFAKRVRKAEALTGAEFHQMLLEYKLRTYLDRKDLHDKRLEADWRKIERLLTGK